MMTNNHDGFIETTMVLKLEACANETLSIMRNNHYLFFKKNFDGH